MSNRTATTKTIKTWSCTTLHICNKACASQPPRREGERKKEEKRDIEAFIPGKLTSNPTEGQKRIPLPHALADEGRSWRLVCGNDDLVSSVFRRALRTDRATRSHILVMSGRAV